MFDNPTDEAIRQILVRAKTIAIVGLSDKPERDSYAVASYLQQAHYRIIPVNPAVTRILGEPSRATLDDLGEDVDILNIFRRSEALPDIFDIASKLDVPVVWTQLGVVDEVAAQQAVRAGITVIMNRCIKIEHRRLV